MLFAEIIIISVSWMEKNNSTEIESAELMQFNGEIGVKVHR